MNDKCVVIISSAFVKAYSRDSVLEVAQRPEEHRASLFGSAIFRVCSLNSFPKLFFTSFCSLNSLAMEGCVQLISSSWLQDGAL